MSSPPHPRPSDDSDTAPKHPRTTGGSDGSASESVNGRDLDYERNNPGPYDDTGNDSDDDGVGVKCKNYELCKCVNPKWWYDFKGHYLCIPCDLNYGTWGDPNGGVYSIGRGALEFTDDLDCSICLESRRSVSLPRCRHTLCIGCFMRYFYGPVFPYPDVLDEYKEDPEDPMWSSAEYPLIAEYLEQVARAEGEQQLKRKLCPLCRQ